MCRALLLIFFLQGYYGMTWCQQDIPARLRVFIDCSNTWCDLTYLRTEINLVDFINDNIAADLHILITGQSTGSGGTEYQLIFFGQQEFKRQTDTLQFYVQPNITEFEQRDMLLRYFTAGLAPFVAQTSLAEKMVISLKSDSLTADTTSAAVDDPWKAWVFRIGAGGNINADANYQNRNFDGAVSANQITETWKKGFRFFWARNSSTFHFLEDDTMPDLIVRNHQWAFNQYVVKSINDHWSWSGELKFSRNTFFNNKYRGYLRAAVEYNLFPYKDVNTKLLTMSYGLTARRNHYFEETIYSRTKENLFGHMIAVYFSMNQKWGNAYTGLSAHQYFHHLRLYNIGMDVYMNVRITGGLSVFMFGFGGLTRDQIYLGKGSASHEEVLARRRQLASGYNYFCSLGVEYRFGSVMNNVVNPRFDRSSSVTQE